MAPSRNLLAAAPGCFLLGVLLLAAAAAPAAAEPLQHVCGTPDLSPEAVEAVERKTEATLQQLTGLKDPAAASQRLAASPRGISAVNNNARSAADPPLQIDTHWHILVGVLSCCPVFCKCSWALFSPAPFL